jgi:hypothetical protein
VDAQRDIVNRAYEPESFDELVGELLRELQLRN